MLAYLLLLEASGEQYFKDYDVSAMGLFISLKIDCFYDQQAQKIFCIARLIDTGRTQEL